MKALLYSILISLALVVPSFAAEQTFIDTAQATVSTNLNQVLIEMLSGVKDAGKEIYGASKDAIHKSVDFVSEQAPDVVKQFLVWKCFEALLNSIGFFFGGLIVLYVSYKCFTKFVDNMYGDDKMFAYAAGFVTLLIATLLLVGGVGHSVKTMVKIKVAPKVYLIEYVVDTVQRHNAQHQ